MNIADIKKTATEKMAKSVETLKNDLAKVRTGRAHAGILDHLRVDYYGTPMPINQVANVTLADARTISIQPFEKKMIQAVEKAIRDSDLGVNPAVSGDVIRVPTPMLTEERRKELTKIVKHEGENSKVAVATLDPTKALGSSAFGPLMFRTVLNGVSGDWQPLATLVRLPVLRELKCPASAELACKLSGSNLFLVQSVSSDADFAHAVDVPDGFPGYSLPVPHPVNDVLYVKLRDDPTVVSRATLNAQPIPPSAEEVARAADRQAAAPAQGPTPQ